MSKLAPEQLRRLAVAYSHCIGQARADVKLLTDDEVWIRFNRDIQPFAGLPLDTSIDNARRHLANWIAMDNAHVETGIK